jgi:uncharacterized protein (DUF697 family)
MAKRFAFAVLCLAMCFTGICAASHQSCDDGDTWSNYFLPWGGKNPKHQRANRIIHGSASSAAGIDFFMAQAPGTARVPVTVVQTLMVVSLASVYGCNVPLGAAIAYAVKKQMTQVGVSVATEMVGVIPGFGNAVKMGVSFALTEALGLGAKAMLKCGGDANLGAEGEGGGAFAEVIEALMNSNSALTQCMSKALEGTDPAGATKRCWERHG